MRAAATKSGARRGRNRPRLTCAAILAVGALAAAPTAAGAATSVEAEDGVELRLTSPGGSEVNEITVTHEATGQVRVTDVAGLSTTSAACVDDGGDLVCTGVFPVATASLGDGGDTIDISDPALTAAGGSLESATITISAGGGIDEVVASDAEDTIDGGGGADRLRGNGGDDLIRGGTGADLIEGGSGTDTADYSERTTGVIVDLTSTPASEDDFADDVENLVGGDGDDALTGNAVSNRIAGGDGNDRVNGGVDAADEDDLEGGAGHDTVSYAGHETGVGVNLGQTTDNGGQASEDDDIDGAFESATGSGLGDTLVGDAGSNVLTGGAGADTLRLGAAPDFADAIDGQVDTIDCQSGGPDGANVDGPAPAETYLNCDTDGDGGVDFFDPCPTQFGTGGGCPILASPIAADPGATDGKKKKCKKRKGKARKKCKKKRKDAERGAATRR